jgi:hypothetical protein
LYSGADPWPAFRVCLPVGVPFAVALVLAHSRALDLAQRSGIGLGFRSLCVLVYLAYGAAGLIFPSLHFLFRPVNLFASVHVLLWGAGLTLAMSQALAMTMMLSLIRWRRS